PGSAVYRFAAQSSLRRLRKLICAASRCTASGARRPAPSAPRRASGTAVVMCRQEQVDRVTRITYWRRIRPTCAWNIVARQLAARCHCVRRAVAGGGGGGVVLFY